MKLGVIVNENFRKAISKLANQSLPLKTSFRLKGIVKKIHAEFVKYEECREAALLRFGSKDEEGKLILDDKNQVSLSSEGMILFAKELGELTQVELEIGKIKVSDLGDNVQLSTDELFILEQILEEE